MCIGDESQGRVSPPPSSAAPSRQYDSSPGGGDFRLPVWVCLGMSSKAGAALLCPCWPPPCSYPRSPPAPHPTPGESQGWAGHSIGAKSGPSLSRAVGRGPIPPLSWATAHSSPFRGETCSFVSPLAGHEQHMDPVPAALFLPALDSVIWAHCSALYCSGWGGGGAPIYPRAEPLGEAG